MGKRSWLNDEEVEMEIAALRNDEDVKLAKAEARAKYRRRQYLYTLRDLKKRGEQIRQRMEAEIDEIP